MFEDSLLESGGRLAHRNPWTTAFSFGVQIFAGGMLVLMSLIYTETMPTQRVLSLLEAPIPPPPAAVAPQQRAVAQTARSTSDFSGTVLIPPSRIPDHIMPIQDVAPPGNPLINTGVGVQNGSSDGVANSVLNDMLRSVPIKVPTASVTNVRVSSGVAQGLLIRQVKPQYPPLARQIHREGQVELHAIISTDGSIQSLQVVSGDPLFLRSAIDAVSQWRYRPTFLSGQPVEIETYITVIYTLQR